MSEVKRCAWSGDDPLMIRYHDLEWGVPCHDDQKLFEYIVLDTFQAGLSWRIVLHKRAAFAKAFANFDPEKVARFGAREIDRLIKDPSIIRNRLKVKGTVKNAQAFLKIQKEFGTFSKYLWTFVGNQPIVHKHRHNSQIASSNKESDALSRDLKQRGFTFVGTTICYAFMQGAGLINDHLTTCFRYDTCG
ncbi:MAG: DNA-3-methyladenine glycosylase I [Candidatus Vogelbacteria bacterium]